MSPILYSDHFFINVPAAPPFPAEEEGLQGRAVPWDSVLICVSLGGAFAASTGAGGRQWPAGRPRLGAGGYACGRQ